MNTMQLRSMVSKGGREEALPTIPRDYQFSDLLSRFGYRTFLTRRNEEIIRDALFVFVHSNHENKKSYQEKLVIVLRFSISTF